MVHTDLRPFYSSTFQGLFKDKSHFFKGFFSPQFYIPGTCNQPLMPFKLLCMGCLAKKRAIHTGICHLCGTGNQITNVRKCFHCVYSFVVWNLSFHLSHLVLEFCPWLFFEVNWLESRRSTSLWILPLSKVHLLFH